MTSDKIINLDNIEYTLSGNGNEFEADLGPVANRIGAKHLGYRITRLPPGKKAFPLHAHYANEEMFFVLEGQGEVRMGEETHPIRKGDFIAAPPDPDCPHQIVNSSDRELIYLCVSTMLQPEVGIYPESGKVGIIAGAPPGRSEGGMKKFFELDNNVSYWKDEE